MKLLKAVDSRTRYTLHKLLKNTPALHRQHTEKQKNCDKEKILPYFHFIVIVKSIYNFYVFNYYSRLYVHIYALLDFLHILLKNINQTYFKSMSDFIFYSCSDIVISVNGCKSFTISSSISSLNINWT